MAKDPLLTGAEAARQAGYKWPAKQASKLKSAWPDLWEKAEQSARESLVMGGREVDERLAAIARDPQHRDHYKALELLARIHGKLNDKFTVEVNRAELNKQLDALIATMVQHRAIDKSQQAAEAN